MAKRPQRTDLSTRVPHSKSASGRQPTLTAGAFGKARTTVVTTSLHRRTGQEIANLQTAG
jgi:hypothetical protein